MSRFPHRTRTPFRDLESLESRELFSFGKLPLYASFTRPHLSTGGTPAPVAAAPNTPGASPTRATNALPAARTCIGQFIQGTLTTLTDASLKLPGESRAGIVLRATILWGDGTSSAATLARTNVANQLSISGGHTYLKPGTFSLRIRLSFTADATTPAGTALPASRIAFQKAITVTVNSDTGRILRSRSRTVSGVLGTTANPGGYPPARSPVDSLTSAGTTLLATVSWGDGSSSSARFLSNPSGGYSLLASHTYPTDGTYRLHITLNAVTSAGTTPIIELLSLASVGRVPGNLPFTSFTFPTAISDFIPLDATALGNGAPILLNPVHLSPNPVGVIFNGSNGTLYNAGAVTVTNGAVLTLGGGMTVSSNGFIKAPTTGVIATGTLTPGSLSLGGIATIGSGSINTIGGSSSSGMILDFSNSSGTLISNSDGINIGSGSTISGNITLVVNGAGTYTLFNNTGISATTLFTVHADGSIDTTRSNGSKLTISPASTTFPFSTGILTFDTNVSPTTIQSALAKLPAAFSGTLELPGHLGDYTTPSLPNATLAWLGGSFDGSAWTGTLDVSSNALVVANAAGAALSNSVINGASGTLAIVDNAALGPITSPLDPNGIIVTHALLGDANLDGKVNLADYNIWYKNAVYNPGDLNMSGTVDISDFNLWFAQNGAAPLAIAP